MPQRIPPGPHQSPLQMGVQFITASDGCTARIPTWPAQTLLMVTRVQRVLISSSRGSRDTCMHTCMHAHTCTHTRMHARAHTQAHKQSSPSLPLPLASMPDCVLISFHSPPPPLYPSLGLFASHLTGSFEASLPSSSGCQNISLLSGRGCYFLFLRFL